MPRTFRFMTLSQASSGCSSAGAPQVAPALLTRMSMWPEPLQGVVDECGRCRFLRRVGGDPARIDAVAAQLRARGFEFVGLARGEHQPRAHLAQRRRDLQAEAARAAGDQRGAAGQVEELANAHGCVSGWRCCSVARRCSEPRLVEVERGRVERCQQIELRSTWAARTGRSSGRPAACRARSRCRPRCHAATRRATARARSRRPRRGRPPPGTASRWPASCRRRRRSRQLRVTAATRCTRSPQRLRPAPRVGVRMRSGLRDGRLRCATAAA